MIKLQLDWSALTGLLDSNPLLQVEILKGVKANFVKTYVKNIIDGKELADLKQMIIQETVKQAHQYVAEIKDSYNSHTFSIGRLRPEILKSVTSTTEQSIHNYVNSLIEQKLEQLHSKEVIDHLIDRRVDALINKEVDSRVQLKINAMMTAVK